MLCFVAVNLGLEPQSLHCCQGYIVSAVGGRNHEYTLLMWLISLKQFFLEFLAFSLTSHGQMYIFSMPYNQRCWNAGLGRTGSGVLWLVGITTKTIYSVVQERKIEDIYVMLMKANKPKPYFIELPHFLFLHHMVD